MAGRATTEPSFASGHPELSLSPYAWPLPSRRATRSSLSIQPEQANDSTQKRLPLVRIHSIGFSPTRPCAAVDHACPTPAASLEEHEPPAGPLRLVHIVLLSFGPAGGSPSPERRIHGILARNIDRPRHRQGECERLTRKKLCKTAPDERYLHRPFDDAAPTLRPPNITDRYVPIRPSEDPTLTDGLSFLRQPS